MASETTAQDAACQCGHASAEHDAKRGGVCLTRSGYCWCAKFVAGAGATAQDAEAVRIVARGCRHFLTTADSPACTACIARALAAARAEERAVCARLVEMADLFWYGKPADPRLRIAAAIRARGTESGVADPTRGDAAGEQAQPPQHRDAAGKPADSSGEPVPEAYCACGAALLIVDVLAIVEVDVTHRREQCEATEPAAVEAPLPESATVAELRAQVERLTWERDTALAGFRTHEAAEKERQEALAAAHAEVARLRAEVETARSVIDGFASAALAPAAPSAEGSGT